MVNSASLEPPAPVSIAARAADTDVPPLLLL
jgi:hypothetical protein